MHCGGGKHRVAFTCKSFLCLRCGRVRSENFVNEVVKKLHPGIIYRHLILTIPDQLCEYFYKRRKGKKLYNEFYKVGFRYIQDVFEKVTKKKLKCGAVVVLHTTGRKCNYRPHLHIIVMNGGIDVISGKWINIGYFPYEKILPRKWQWHLLNMIKDFDSSPETKKLVQELWAKYPNGFYNRFKEGSVPNRCKHVVRYLAKYLFRPMISIKRILEYDEKDKFVTYEYADHKTGDIERERVSTDIFIGRLMQQLLPKGFHKVKYYGLHRPKSYRKSAEIVQNGMKGAAIDRNFRNDPTLLQIGPDGYQQRMKKWTGVDPLQCPCCGTQMEIVKVWSLKYGPIFDLLEQYQRMAIPPPKNLKKIIENIPSEPIDIVRDSGRQLELCFVS